MYVLYIRIKSLYERVALYGGGRKWWNNMKDLIKDLKKELENGLEVATGDLKSRVVKNTSILKDNESRDLIANLKDFKKVLNQKIALTYSINEVNATSFRKRLINSYKLTIEKEGAIQYNLNITPAVNNASAIYTQLISDLIHLIGYKLGYNTTTNGGKQNTKYFGAIAEALGFEVVKGGDSKKPNYLLSNISIPSEFKYNPVELSFNRVIKDSKKDNKKPSQRERLNALVEKYSKLEVYKPLINELKNILNIK